MISMKRNLTAKETVTITSMLFGMFFGAGNLIFPAKMGTDAGSNLWSAFFGVFITAVGIPMLAVVALGLSRCEGVVPLANKVGKKYSTFFCCLLYLTIGPLFAIPRCASTSFSVGAVGLLGDDHGALYLALFSLLFFAVVLAFSLRPSGIMTWIGKLLNPVFLAFLFALVIAALINPVDRVADVIPAAKYATNGDAFFSGFLEGYNTLDALAGLAFGIVVVNVLRETGIKQPERVAANTAKAGVFSCLLMGVIYLLVTVMGTWSRGALEAAPNGGAALAQIAQHYLGRAGLLVLAATVTLACLKTAVGLITSCAETFEGMFPKALSYRQWVLVFCGASFLFANVGLTAIITYAVPVLMFLYPLAITLILLALLGRFFDHDRAVYCWVTGLTLVAALYDLLRTLPEGVRALLHADGLIAAVGNVLPFATIGLGWVAPAVLGLVIGLIFRAVRPKKA